MKFITNTFNSSFFFLVGFLLLLGSSFNYFLIIFELYPGNTTIENYVPQNFTVAAAFMIAGIGLELFAKKEES